MRTVDRHLLGQLLGAALLGALLLAALVFLLQALRLGHHLAGSGAGASLVGRLLLLGAPSLLGFSLPFAAAAAVLLVWSRLADSGQLVALQAAGASPAQLARPVLVLLVLCAALALVLGRWLEPRCLERMQALLVRHAGNALVSGLRPGQFHAISPELALYAESPRAGGGEATVKGFFLARGSPPPQQLLAREARLRTGERATLELELRDGELRGSGLLEEVRFGRASFSLDLWPALRPHLGFVSARAAEAPARAVRSAAASLALGLLALLIGFRARRSWLRGSLGLAAALAVQGLAVAAGGPLGVAVLVGVAGLALLALITSPG